MPEPNPIRLPCVLLHGQAVGHGKVFAITARFRLTPCCMQLSASTAPRVTTTGNNRKPCAAPTRAWARTGARRRAGGGRGRRHAIPGRNSSTFAIREMAAEFSKAFGGVPSASTEGGLCASSAEFGARFPDHQYECVASPKSQKRP